MLKAVFIWENNDSTQDLNARFKAFLNRGILEGGLAVPVSGQMKVEIQPFSAFSYDGMLVTDEAVHTFDIPNNQTSILTIHAKYQLADAPILEYVLYEATAFNNLLTKDEHIVIGAVTTNNSQTEINLSDISYNKRDITDKLGRSAFRGWLSDVGDLPTERNRPGDFYIVHQGIGDVPFLYGWDGVSTWINLTDTVTLASDLAIHRANGFIDEVHLTEDQSDAALGSFGNPSNFNRYVTEADPRLLTTDESDALDSALSGPISQTNPVVSGNYPLAEPSRVEFVSPPGFSLQLSASAGPFYVGNGVIGTAIGHFMLVDYDAVNDQSNINDKGYLNSSDEEVRVTGVFRNSALTLPLDPSADSDSDGFYTGDVWLQLDKVIDTSVAVSFGKKVGLKDIDNGLSVRYSPANQFIPASVLRAIIDIKGRPFESDIPDREQNINLRSSLDDIIRYLGSVQETNIIANARDYDLFENDPELGLDFERNQGIDPVPTYTHDFTAANYGATTGTVQYLDTGVNLSDVRIGDIWVDGNDAKYKVNSVNFFARLLTIRNLENNGIPNNVNLSFTTTNHGSCFINNNPRNLLLSELKVHRTEQIQFSNLVPLKDDYSKPDGFLAQGILRNGLVDPRIVFYGPWESHTDSLTGEFYVRNASFEGRIEITGFITDIILLCDAEQGSPDLNIAIDGQNPSYTVSTSTNLASFVQGQRSHKVLIAQNLPDDRPNHVSISIGTIGQKALEIYGFEIHYIDASGDANIIGMESGLAFKKTKIRKRDVVPLVTDFKIPFNGLVSPNIRGGSIQYFLGDSGYEVINNFLPDIDLGVEGNASGNTLNVTNGSAKLVNFRVNDIVQLRGTLAVETRIIIGISSGSVTFNSTVTSQIASLDHICSTSTNIPFDSSEREIGRYELSLHFFGPHKYDFSPLNTGIVLRRIAESNDQQTIVAAWDSDIVNNNGTGFNVKVLNSGAFIIGALATRVDVIFENLVSTNIEVSINQSPSFSLNVQGGLRRQTIYSNGRYTWHEAKITSTQDMFIKKIIIYGPNHSKLIDRPELAAFDALSSYVPASSLDENPMRQSSGVYFKHALWNMISRRVLFPLDGTTWHAHQNSKQFGLSLRSSNSGDTLDFYFRGSCFEVLYREFSEGGQFYIEIDGTPLDQIPSIDIIGNYGALTNTSSGTIGVDCYGATDTLKVIGAKGLTHNLHHVVIKQFNPRLNNPSSTDHIVEVYGYNVGNDDNTLTYGMNPDGNYTPVIDKRQFTQEPIERDERTLLPFEPELVINSGYGVTDLSATGKNLTVSTNGAGNTRIELDFKYEVGVSSGSPDGALEVKVDGKHIPRRVVGSTQDAYYEEVDNQTIDLDSFYGNDKYSVEVIYRRVIKVVSLGGNDDIVVNPPTLSVVSGYGILNNTLIGNNLSVSTFGGVSRISLGFAYETGVAIGSPDGALEVKIDGKHIPRYVPGITQTAYYTEVNSTTIDLDSDYSSDAYSVEVIYRTVT